MNTPSLEILNETHNLSTFDCGNADLNDFLKNDALQNQKDRLSVTRLIFLDKNLAGFFTITPDTLHKGRVILSDKYPVTRMKNTLRLNLHDWLLTKDFSTREWGRNSLFHFSLLPISCP